MQSATAEFPVDLEEVPGSQSLIMLRRWYSVVVFILAVDNKSPHNTNYCSRDEARYCVTEHFMKTHTFIQTRKGL